ncbi:TPA: hypothetical protein N3282_003903 [Klebsiella aerogenes]|nr:hypothetical protein [Klebsiella aerogenes]HDG7792111.1 hypothetical protein [Klebsiella aerogenes]
MPEPKPEWQVANWITANIFSAYFGHGDYNEAKKRGEMTLQTKVRTISLNDKNPRYCVGFAMRKPFEQMV